MDDTFILVLTTVATEAQAATLARSIVSAGLAACVQIQPIRSVYRWKGEVCDEPECLLMIKTAARRYAALEQHIKANHAYETPEIVQLPITGGSPQYLHWIEASLGST
jgi:periplasmic divalent cation tolerance protein